MYKETMHQARVLGGSLVAKNVANLLQDKFSHVEKSTRIAVYCSRGGMRSKSLATVLEMVGYEVSVVDRGYKAYRQLVLEELEELPKGFRFFVLHGLTGTKKTVQLNRLKIEFNQQVLDLEFCARHRGSVLGSYRDELQPTQRMFDSRLANELRWLDPTKPVWVEGESQKIGNLLIPTTLWQRAVLNAEHVFELQASEEDRVAHLMKEYAHFVEPQIKEEDTARFVSQLKEILTSLESIVSNRTTIQSWLALVEERRFPELVASLLQNHYDLRYKQSRVNQTLSPRSIKIGNDVENALEYLKTVETESSPKAGHENKMNMHLKSICE